MNGKDGTQALHPDPRVAENRRKWLEMLRRDDVEMTRHQLEDGGRPKARCCLGHACAALEIEREEFEGRVFYGQDEDQCFLVLPSSVARALDITTGGALRPGMGYACDADSGKVKVELSDLSQVNDYARDDLTPAAIADFIEDAFRKGGFYGYAERPA